MLETILFFLIMIACGFLLPLGYISVYYFFIKNKYHRYFDMFFLIILLLIITPPYFVSFITG